MDDMPNKNAVAAGVKKSFEWLDRLAILAIVFMAAVCISKFLGATGASLAGVQFPPGSEIYGLLFLSGAHFFVSRHVILSCGDAWTNLSLEDRGKLFEELVRTGGFLTKGAEKYRGSISVSSTQISLNTEISEPPTWVHILLVVLTFLSVVEFSWSAVSVFKLSVVIAVVYGNWKLGENWIICLGDLGSREGGSSYFIDGTARPRNISYASGFTINGNISFPSYFLSVFIGAAFIMLGAFLVLGFFYLAISLSIHLSKVALALLL
ncbi:hypothetical protein [Roseivivax sp. CAU 1761]